MSLLDKIINRLKEFTTYKIYGDYNLFWSGKSYKINDLLIPKYAVLTKFDKGIYLKKPYVHALIRLAKDPYSKVRNQQNALAILNNINREKKEEYKIPIPKVSL